jgi:hypothetical protein
MKAQQKDHMRKLSPGPWRRSLAFAGIGAVLASLISPAAVSAATAATTDAVLKVTIVRDVNANGLADGASEPGVAGIPVQLIDAAGHLVTELSGSDGVATFAPSSELTGGRYRVEASIPTALDYLSPAFVDPNSTAANRFVPMTTQVDLRAGSDQTLTMGVWNPNDFVTANPELVTAQGWGNAFGDIGAQHSVMGFNYNDRSDRPDQSTPGKLGPGDNLATAGQVGSVWGVAAQGRNQVYVSSYNRWGVDVGPGGRGAIYKVNLNGQGPSSQVFATIADAGQPFQTPNSRDKSLAPLPETVGFFKSIGREGLGGLEISANGDRLYTVNLNTKSLITIPIKADGTAGTLTSTAIANPGCPGGAQDWRPWGLKVKDGDVYVGGVCSGETSGDTKDLRAVVYKVDALAPVFTADKVIVDKTLDYVRGADVVDPEAVSGSLRGCSADYNTYGWRAWTDDPTKWGYCPPYLESDLGETNYPTPLLTDIDVQADGSLVLGFGNRTTLQLGANSYTIDGSHRTGFGGPGDINKVCLTGGTYVWEGDAGCALPPSQSWSGSAGGATPEPEFFSGDFWAPTHYEITGGGLRYLPGQKYLVTNAIDPRDLYNGVSSTQGVLWLDNTTGRKPDGAVNTNILTSGVDFQQVNQMGADASFGKAMSMGDIAVLANNAPIQIGNYVWIDANGNGVQDPGEKSAPGVTVHLYATDENGNRTGAPIATTVTNADGEYYFDSINDGLQPGTKYVVAVDNAADYQSGGPLADYKPTVPNTGQETLAGRDTNDSDGIASTDPARQIDARRGGFPEVAVTTGNEGRNNHTYDFGFTTLNGVGIVKGDVKGNAADTAAAAAGFTPGESRGLSFQVTNTGSSQLEHVVVTDSTITGGAVTGMQCVFPGETDPTIGVATGGTWVVRWAASFDAGALWAPGVVFDCTATLTMAGTAAPHADAAVVDASVVGTGVPVTDRNDYHAFTGQVQVIKYDDRDGTFTPERNADGVPNKPLTVDPQRDANTAGTAVKYPIGAGQASTGPQRVEFAVTNTGVTWLTQVNLADLTLDGPALQGLTCDFTAAGDPAAPTSGTTWVGPWAPGSTFYCQGTVDLAAGATHGDNGTVHADVVPPKPNPSYDPSDPASDPFTDQPTLDGNGVPVRSDIHVTDEDPFHAETTNDGVGIVKGDVKGNAADTAAAAAGFTPGESRGLSFQVTNTGSSQLEHVVVTDSTITGGAVTGMQCVFPGETDPTIGVATGGTWVVRWAASFDAGALWAPGVVFDCTATLTMAGTAAPHADAAVVDASVVGTGVPVTDRNDYHAFTGQVQVIKYDDRDGTFTPERNADGVPNKPLTVDPQRDANTAGTAVKYPIGAGQASTGPQRVEFAVTNTGVTWLTQVNLADLTLDGPALQGLTCDFTAAGDPAAPTSGTTWVGPWAPGSTFYCQGTVDLAAGATHGDNGTVHADVVPPKPNPSYDPSDPASDPFTDQPTLDGNGVPVRSDIHVTDEDPFHAEGTALPVTELDKKLLSQEKLDDGTWAVKYALVVTNISALADTYTLTDALRFGRGIDVISATVKAVEPGTPAPNPNWNGVGDTLVVKDANIGPKQTHRFEVDVRASAPATSSADLESTCPTPGASDQRGGFLNVADLTATNSTSHDQACGEFTPPTPPTPPSLARTGFDAGIFGGLAAALLAAGGVLMLVRRRGNGAQG